MEFVIHGSMHRRLLSRNTNKMQLCNRIYYSKVYWRLNMFRAAHLSSSGTQEIFFPLSLGNGRSPHGYINQWLQVQFRAPNDERCTARNMLSLLINFVIINSITKLHLVGISTEKARRLFPVSKSHEMCRLGPTCHKEWMSGSSVFCP